MALSVFLAVLAAALMHATWNALVKAGSDRFGSILMLSAAQCAISVAALPFLSAPERACWPWLGASALLHIGYKLFLAQAYRHGDLAQVYPLARGSAPMIVALVGALALGEELSAQRALAVALIGLGVVAMSLRGGADFGRLPQKALAYALGTACFTAGYTLVDAIGARLSGSAAAYTFSLFALDGAGMIASGLFSRGASAFRGDATVWRSGVLAGALSLASYWVAIWAFTQAPVALVAALRETSVLMAMLIGVAFLGESGGPWRWLAGGLIASGVIAMRL